YNSPTYKVSLLDRPSVLSFNVKLDYPGYLNKPSEQLSNVGNLLVPQGTVVNWEFAADHTDSLLFRFNTDAKPTAARLIDDNTFVLNRKLMQNAGYTVSLKNGQVASPSTIQYNVQVIPDRFPQVSVDRIQDTVTYNYIALSGLVSDDYGFSKLRLNYKINRNGKPSPLYSKDIPINKSTTSQNFIYNWSLDSLKLGQEDKVEYYVQVWDNDGVNGAKSSRSNQLNFSIPSNAEIQKQVDKSAEKTEEQIDNALSKTQAIKKELQTMEDRMRTKKSSDFQDKKQLQDILQKREELMKEVQKLQEQMQKTNDTQQRFAEKNQAMQDKMEQLQKLFKDLLDPESKQLYEQLKQLLERKQDEKASDMLDRLTRKEKNMERDLD
ncbi:MAG: ATPase, partial [Pedobacter sp.]